MDIAIRFLDINDTIASYEGRRLGAEQILKELSIFHAMGVR